MKKAISASLIIMTFFGMFAVYLITSCKKNKVRTCEDKSRVRTLGLQYNESTVFGRFYDGGDKANLSSFESTENQIDYILNSYAVTLGTGENPIGLALYYSGEVDTNNITATTPIAMIVYKQMEGRIWAQLYNKVGTNWLQDTNCWGITTGISASTVYDIILDENLTVENVVIFQSNSFPDEYYFSNFEAKQGSGGGTGGGGSGYAGKCNSSSSCDSQTEGACVKLKNGGGYICEAGGCVSTNAVKQLTDHGYTIPELLLERHYSIRNSILNQNRRRTEFIDDYYYASTIINESVLDLDLALSAYSVYQSNFIRKMANISNPDYADTVLINVSERTKLLNLCTQAGTYSTDSRYKSIIDTVVANINRLYNQPISYVNTHF